MCGNSGRRGIAGRFFGAENHRARLTSPATDEHGIVLVPVPLREEASARVRSGGRDRPFTTEPGVLEPPKPDNRSGTSLLHVRCPRFGSAEL